MTKKKWEKPQLIVLVRGRPEEAVLVTCKGSLAGGPGATEDSCRAGGSPECGAACQDYTEGS